MVSNNIVKINQLRYEPEVAARGGKNQPSPSSSSFINTISHAGKSSRLYNWGHIFPVLAEEHGILVNEDLQSLIVEVGGVSQSWTSFVQHTTCFQDKTRQDEDKTRQGKTRQDRRQDWTQDKTRQDKTVYTTDAE